MSQNTTESQEPNSPTTSLLLTNSRMLLERMQCTLGFLTAHLETFQELENDYNRSCKLVGLPGYMLFVQHNGPRLKSLLETSSLTLQLESLYASLLESILEQS